MIAKIIRRIKKSYFLIIIIFMQLCFVFFFFFWGFFVLFTKVNGLMVSIVLRKKYKRVHIPRRINRFKFYSKAAFIASDTLQHLKMDLSFGKGHDQCGDSTLCQSFVHEYVRRFV